MNFGVADRVVVITGASRGLGRILAKEFANEGAKLGLLARDEGALQDLSEQIPTESVPVACDISSLEAVDFAFKEVVQRLGRIDSVVANAGIGLAPARAQNLLPDVWREVIDTNLTGTFYTAHVAHQYLRSSHAGRMVLISSGAAQRPMRGLAAYGSSKAGIEGLTRALCADWSVDGICVNAVAPGLFDNGDPAPHSGRVKELLISRTPMRRVGEATELANMVLFLSGDLCSFITGQVVAVDGGYGIE